MDSSEVVVRSCVETDSIETGLRKTRASPTSPLRMSPSRSASTAHERTTRSSGIVRECSNLSKASSSSGNNVGRDGNCSSPEGSPLKRATPRANSFRKLPPTGSPPSKHVGFMRSSSGTSNTWNGRSSGRQRPSLETDTFMDPRSSSASNSNFSRKCTVRQSLPRSTSTHQYDRNGRRIRAPTTSTSLQSSPTKVANPLLEQILQKVGHLQDDKQVVQKLQDLLRDYRGNRPGENDPNLEFTRAWIDGNGTVAALPPEPHVIATPRKDPKPVSGRGNFSRIPAPVVNKRPMSVASDSM